MTAVMNTSQNIAEACDFIRAQLDFSSPPASPDIALVLGSGLGEIANSIEGVRIPYGQIPGCKTSTVPTHTGELVLGQLEGRSIVAMSGRLHRYEGYSSGDVVFPVRVMAALGAKQLVVTNAAGSLSDRFATGDIALIEDHLSLANLAGEDPLRFGYEPELGERFVGLNQAYAPRLLELVEQVIQEQSLTVERGVYAYVTGPSFETPAEVRMLASLGCDLVGMSTVPEVLAARQAGMEVLGISAITNVAVHAIEDAYMTNAEDIFAALRLVQPKIAALVQALVSRL